MSKNLDKVIQRAISDAAFRRQLQANPVAALRGFKLTDDEVAALRSGDAGKLVSLGIDQRMSKAFAVGGAMAQNMASRAATDGGLSLGGAALADGDAARMGSTLIPGNPNLGNADVDPGTTSSDAITTGTYTVRDVAPTSVGDPLITDTSTSDAIEDAGHAAAAARFADMGTTIRSADAIEDAGHAAAAARFSDTAAGSSADAIEDAGHAAAADRFAATQGATTSALRDSEPVDLRSAVSADTSVSDSMEDAGHAAAAARFSDTAAGSSADAIEDAGHAAAAARFSDMQGATASAIRDSEPVDLRGAVSDNVLAAEAGRQGSLAAGNETFASSVRDSDPVDLRGAAIDDTTGTITQVRDSEPADLRGAVSDNVLAAEAGRQGSLAAGNETFASSVRDSDPVDLRGAALTDDASGHISRINDTEPVDLRGAVATPDATGQTSAFDADSTDAYAPQFHTGGAQGSVDSLLTEDEAAAYSSTHTAWSGDQIDEAAQGLTPDTTSAIPDHTGGDETISNTGTNDPQISQ